MNSALIRPSYLFLPVLGCDRIGWKMEVACALIPSAARYLVKVIWNCASSHGFPWLIFMFNCFVKVDEEELCTFKSVQFWYILTYLYTPETITIIIIVNIAITPRSLVLFTIPTSFPSIPYLQLKAVLLLWTGLYFLESYINGIIWYEFCFAWLISLNITVLKFTDTVVCIFKNLFIYSFLHSFLFQAVWHCMNTPKFAYPFLLQIEFHCMDIPKFICPPVNRHLSCFQFLAITNKDF